MRRQVSHPATGRVFPSLLPRGRSVLATSLPSILVGLLLTACGGGGSSTPGQSGIPGEELVAPASGGRTFFVDGNLSGQAASLTIASLSWGRLVDIHDTSFPSGATNIVPIFRDFVVDPDIPVIASPDYRLEDNPLTGRQRLVILAARGTSGTPTRDAFNALVDGAVAGLRPIAARNDDGNTAGPFSIMQRNACAVVQFNDCLDDDAAATAALTTNVRVLTGYPPIEPFFPRVIFDPNHGAIINGTFHSTRVLVDMTVSADESFQSGTLADNPVGLPPSLTTATTLGPNVSIRIPTVIVPPNPFDPSQTQLTVLQGLSGSRVDATRNGPVDTNARMEIVRAFQSGNSSQLHNGFLMDDTPPSILGEWNVTAQNPVDVGALAGRDFEIDITFSTICASAMEVGDLLELGTHLLEVTADTAAPVAGVVTAVEVRALAEAGIADVNSLVGAAGFFNSAYDPGLAGVPIGCWINFTPEPATLPETLVSSSAKPRIRFSEAMDPALLTALDTLLVIAGDDTTTPSAINMISGTLTSVMDTDNRIFVYEHGLPFSHVFGTAEEYTLLSLEQPQDLAGNAVANNVPAITFTLDDQEPTRESGGFVFRFDDDFQIGGGSPALNEIGNPADGSITAFPDFTGSLNLDLDRGVLLARTPTFQSFVVDYATHLALAPGLRGPVGGSQEPLTRLGAKLQTVWRYHDLGLNVLDPTGFDLDVVGLNWAPQGGLVASDFFSRFEIKLATASQLPDESFIPVGTGFVPAYPLSGLHATPGTPFTANVLGGANAQKTVHARDRGYTIRPRDRFQASNMMTMVPYPLNQNLSSGEAMQSFTWRNTANEEKSDTATLAVPVPQTVERLLGLLDGNGPGGNEGGLYPQGSPISAVAMPLLMEYSCFPESIGLGTNRFMGLFSSPVVTIGLTTTVTSGPGPVFTARSVGGRNAEGVNIPKDPDGQVSPSGGFNPMTGQPEGFGDTLRYIGQLDTVIRVTRVISHWLNTQQNVPVFGTPVLEPAAEAQPAGTSVVLDFRGAVSFTGMTMESPYDPAQLDPHGDPLLNMGMPTFGVNYFNADDSWTNDVTQLQAQFLQVRISFINNIENMTSPELAALGLPFEFN